MTRRRWIADRWTENSATLLEEQAAHLARVLRAQVGQEFDIVAGHAVRRGIVEKVSAESVELSLHEEMETAKSLPLIVGLSIVRFERMEWAIEKLTELGVARIIPLRAQRSEKHLVQAATKRCERWRKISRESAQQSRRSQVPEISEPMSVTECIAESNNSLRYLFSEEERSRSLWESLMTTDRNVTPSAKIYAAIGPEGGWTLSELSSFAECGWQSVSLGKNILRTETAAIAVASLISAWWNG
ncbi:MAG TPA: RsmE family RNA methyltransferase [Acidobacteriaceae bacterium]|nr:RsmE family RNA methyltransferase [Acidobacteriaceae bacterium]